MPLVFSFSNLASTATVLAKTSEIAGFCSTNALQPQRPFLPWKTADACSTQELILDLGSTQTIELLAIVNANFAGARLQGMSSSGFTAPSFTETVVLGRNPYTWRFQHTLLTTAFGYRYARLAVSSQSPTDGATGFSLGGLWLGIRSTAPKYWRWGAQMETLLPRQDVGPSHEAWRQRLKTGEPYVRVHAQLMAGVCTTSPGSGDQLDDWLDLQRQAWDKDHFFAYVNLSDASQGWVVRSLDNALWNVDARLAEGPWTLEELVGP